jgi:hypothetical protein
MTKAEQYARVRVQMIAAGGIWGGNEEETGEIRRKANELWNSMTDAEKEEATEAYFKASDKWFRENKGGR